MNNVKQLSKDEMKNVLGGVAQMSCTCTGCTGSWTYSDNPTAQQMVDDISSYCSTGEGSCSR